MKPKKHVVIETKPLTPPDEESKEEEKEIVLSDKALHFHKIWDGNFRHKIPPSSPISEFDFEYQPANFPKKFPDPRTIKLPCVRAKGIKACIEELAEVFNCRDYKYNYLHFWFLDVIVDCIWRAQDQFQFPQEQQTIILGWILFAFDLVRDLDKNYNKNEFFTIFKEAVLIAAEVLEEGSGDILLPMQLLTFDKDEIISEQTSIVKTPETSIGFKSLTDDQDSMDYQSVVEFNIGNEVHHCVLPHESCVCSELESTFCGSFERMLEEQSVCMDSKLEKEFEEFEEFEDKDNEDDEDINSFIDDDWDYRDFYKPDSRPPSRFLPLTKSQELMDRLMRRSEKTKPKEHDEEFDIKKFGPLSQLSVMQIRLPSRKNKTSQTSSEKFSDYILFRKENWSRSTIGSNSSLAEFQVSSSESDAKSKSDRIRLHLDESDEKQKNLQIMKGLQEFKKMEQRVRDFSDSQIGLNPWQMSNQSDEEELKEGLSSLGCIDAEDASDIKIQLNITPNHIKDQEQLEFLSFGVLWVVVDFVYEYFSDNFQYTLIKTAMTAPPNLIVQKLNDKWHTPKDLSEDLTKFVKDIKNKNSPIIIRQKIKKETKKQEVKKEIKPEKKKTDEKKQADKKPPVKLTESELALIEQKEKEQEKLYKEYLNEVHLFPLQEGVTDDFFKEKFRRWQKVDFRKTKGKK